MTAARALAGRPFRVHVFEKDGRAGGHAHTIWAAGRPLDTGFLVFNEARYPIFSRMLRELGVSSRATDMAFSVSAGDFEYGSSDLSAFFAQRGRLVSGRHWRFGRRILGFLGKARRDLAGGVGIASLEEYLHDAPEDIREYFAYPLAGALWSMGRRELSGFPAEIFLGFLENHGMLRPLFPPKWRTIRGGSRVYVEALLRQTPIEVHLNAEVRSVGRAADHVLLGFADGSEQRFDRVVLACHADQALALLADPSQDEQEILGAIRFTANDVWLHTDRAYLPRAESAWASWNYQVTDREQVAVTYWLNRLQGHPGPETFCVTLNPASPPAGVLAHYQTTHPAYDVPGLLAQKLLPTLNGRRHTAFAGAYFGYGFHEDGARAGMAAAQSLR